MWKRLFICLVVCLLALSSLSAYPAWVYGGKKASLEVPQTPSEVPSEETQQEAPEQPLMQEESLPKEVCLDSLEQLKSYLTESEIEEALVEAICDYIDQIQLGIDVMADAYEQEVAEHEKTEKAYNDLVASGVVIPQRFSVTVSPYATYAPFEQEWGIGASVGINWKKVGAVLGVIKPSVKSLEDFKNPNDLMVSAGFSFTF